MFENYYSKLKARSLNANCTTFICNLINVSLDYVSRYQVDPKIRTDYVSTGSLQILPNVLIIIHYAGVNRITIFNVFIELNINSLRVIIKYFA